MESIEFGRTILVLILSNFLLSSFGEAKNGPHYYGSLIGNLKTYGNGVTGRAYAVDDTTIFIEGFSYDGLTPDAYLWMGKTEMPSPAGDIIPYPEDYVGPDPPELKAHNNTNIILRLPQGKRIRDMKWLSVWCRRFTLNFGHVYIPERLEIPKPRILPEFSRLAHGLSSGNISILDSKTIYIPNLHYDGAGPDAYFWVGNGTEPNSLGIKVPNEAGKLTKLRGYQGEDIEIVLPGTLTVYDIEWLSVWCVTFKHNFGHVMIPKDLDVPPALGQTKITTSSAPVAPPPTRSELTNCKEMLEGRLQVQWETIGDDVRIRLSARINEDQWASFGLSGREGEAKMLGGDVVVVAYDSAKKKFIAEDYFMSSYSQCDGRKGVCPDKRIGGRNDVTFLNGQRKNGVTTVEYKRPLRTNEPEKDKMIPDFETSVIAAIGPLNSAGEANSHTAYDKTNEDIRIDFNSKNVHECSNSLYDIPDQYEIAAWPPASIVGENNFNVRIGPSGGDRGYTRITGQSAWGISWYVNDLLIPELTLERGQTYTFVVEGGNDPVNPARYHPFYITTSPEGGYGQKTEAQQMEQKVFAGVAYDSKGFPYPTAAGRYCEWVHKTVDMSTDSETFESFFETLRLDCDQGEPAKLVWTVADDTPDLVYYQCYEHNNLGWKIHVVDAGYRSRRDELNGVDSTVLPSIVTILTIVGLRLTLHR